MDDQTLLHQINELAQEEHELFQKEADAAATDTEKQRLKSLQITLDQCWDLLRQRRARRTAGMDPDQAAVRDADTVEGYIG